MQKCSPLVLVCLSLFTCIGLQPSSAHAESTISCPSGTYDMLDWMTLDSGIRGSYYLAGNANPLYTNMGPGKFYWTKGANGTPWDIQLFDNNYIYLWITELNWNDPHTFKKFTNNTNEPLVPRCAKADSQVQPLTCPILPTRPTAIAVITRPKISAPALIRSGDHTRYRWEETCQAV